MSTSEKRPAVAPAPLRPARPRRAAEAARPERVLAAIPISPVIAIGPAFGAIEPPAEV
jgi:hypothetical protein